MPKKQKHKSPYRKDKRPANKRFAILAVSSIILLAAAVLGFKYVNTLSERRAIQEYKSWSNQILETAIQDARHKYNIMPDGGCAVFVSWSDGKDRAQVRYGTGKDLKTAWQTADDALLSAVGPDVGPEKAASNAEYIKYDIIYETQSIQTLDLRLKLSVTPIEAFQYGIIFDEDIDLSHAMLKHEIDALKPYDTNTWEFNILQINGYLHSNGRQQLKDIPTNAQIFTCDGWLYDVNSGEIITLQSEKKQYGIRKLELTQETILNMIQSSNRHLANRIENTGRFEYEIQPLTLNTTDEYSSVRHVGTLWAMCQNAGLTGDFDTKPAIDRSIEYLIKNCIEYDTDGNAYFVESYSDDIEIGGTGLAITMFQTYEDVFDSDQYDDLIAKLAGGLIKHQDASGKIPHVMNKDFEVTEDFYVIYFDGEACLGLFRAYERLQSPEILETAVKLFNYFTASGYQEKGDHWLAYAANEITKIYPNETRYYEFAFDNAQSAFDAIEYNQVISPTDLELLANTCEIYNRAVKNDIKIPESFDCERLTRLTDEQAERELNRYMLPEKAMYSKACNRITGTYYMDITNDWRIRIDDVQHYANGHCLYYKLIK